MTLAAAPPRIECAVSLGASGELNGEKWRLARFLCRLARGVEERGGCLAGVDK